MLNQRLTEVLDEDEEGTALSYIIFRLLSLVVFLRLRTASVEGVLNR